MCHEVGVEGVEVLHHAGGGETALDLLTEGIGVLDNQGGGMPWG